MQQVVTRFAPSPTGYLHIGGARTALFNWLYARHFGGKFLLRIEDTDRERSTQDAIDKIIEGLKWLNLDWDDEVIYQFSRAPIHAKVAMDLVKKGKAYFCYCTQEELEKMRAEAVAAGKSPKYTGVWRDRSHEEAPAGIKPVVRLKADHTGRTDLHDMVQGVVSVDNSEIDDFILLRSDGTPTYMLSVVVDDHDMGITHVIRGDDHLTNTFRQMQIYQACGWECPTFAHIPLIHGPDGAKLSKRHGALGVENYKDMGYLWETLCNYLLRLGWSHGDDEIMSMKDAIAWFDGTSIGKSPSRLDFMKFTNLNAHYIRESEDDRLVEEIKPIIEKEVNRDLSDSEKQRLLKGMPGLKQRAKLITDLAKSAYIYLDGFSPNQLLESSELLNSSIEELRNAEVWEHDCLEQILRNLADIRQLKFGEVAKVIRLALTNMSVSPSIFDIMLVLGKDETMRRLTLAVKL